MVLFAKVSLAQGDTTWFDSDWKETSKYRAIFYRLIKKTDKGFLVTDCYFNGNPQMIAEAIQVTPSIIKEGFCTYFYKNNIKSSKGNYINNKKSGTWVEYFGCEKDSSIYTTLEDGTKEYTLKSKYQDVFTMVEVMPEYPGGVSEMISFFSKSAKYPKEARKKGWVGKSYLNFIVNEKGEITLPKIVKSSGYDILDEEALRVIKSMPNWSPGSQNGKNVLVSINVPFNFTLND